MESNLNSWSEEDSKMYQQLAAVAVPDREEQIAALLSLLPFAENQSFRAIELGCGEGFLSQALLEAYPASSVLALDGSEKMRTLTAKRLARRAGRFEVAEFELGSSDWRPLLRGANAVVSSLCLHHLPDPEKQILYKNVFEALEPGGAFLIIDLVEPTSERARALFADQWDLEVKRRSRDLTDSETLFDRFRDEQWNHYRYPDAVDLPSPLSAHLSWLQEAGFREVDAFTMTAGHALFGGFKDPLAKDGLARLDLRSAQETVELVFS